LTLGYPDLEDERKILRAHEPANPLEHVEPVMSQSDVLELQEHVGEVRFDDTLLDYLLQIVDATRKSESLELGVSPRGTLSLFRSAQALDFIEGRASHISA